MRLFRTLTIATAVLTLSAAAFAAQTAPAPKAAKPAKASKATAIIASGTVSKFDAASNMLTVTTASGDVSFAVGTTTSITASGKKAMASDLSSHVGQKVTVHYTEANGQKMAQSVKVTAASGKTASTKKTSTTKKS